MCDSKYLLTLDSLQGRVSDALRERCFRWLDRVRLEKAKACTNPGRWAEYVGGGILLRLALTEACKEDKSGGEIPQTGIRLLTPEEILECLESAERQGEVLPPPEYYYEKKGKPRIKDCPLHFNLSHSGGYVFLVLSREEVGVDIQQVPSRISGQVMSRILTEEEGAALEAMGTEEEIRREFARIWSRKEAAGKLTGEGLAYVLDGMQEKETGGCTYPGSWEAGFSFETFAWRDFYLTICKWRQEQNRK